MTGAPELVTIDGPTLLVAACWIERHCVVPDREVRGAPFILANWQLEVVGNHYRVRPEAQPGQLSPAFVFRRSQVVMPQKALALNTPIATPTGWTTMGRVQPGDFIFAGDGEPTRVATVSPVFSDGAYRLTFSDGATLVACGEHEWVVDRRLGKGAATAERWTTADMASFGLADSAGARRFRVKVHPGIKGPEVELPVPPYTLGAWLGDGCVGDGRIVGIDQGVFDRIALDGFEVRPNRKIGKRQTVIGLRAPLRTAGVFRDKHIPTAYLRAGEKQRWALLQGLMDTDGYADAHQGKCEFTTTNQRLCEDVSELLHSLGIKHRVYAGRATLYGRDTGPKWRVSFAARSDMPVFGLERKQSRLTSGTAHAQFQHRRIVAIDEVGAVPTRCLTVEHPSHTFLAGREMIVTGNSGKSPLTAALVCLEAVGPALFAGWAKGGEVYDCADHGCPCGWRYGYEKGEPMGRCWPTPLIQITAFSFEQTDNVYDALRPMIERGPLKRIVGKVTEDFIRLPNGGRIDVVTSSAKSRLGQRVTFVPMDQTESWTPASGMVKVAETQRRGLAGMGGRAVEFANAWDPGENSVAQRTAESESSDIYRLHPMAAANLSYGNKRERTKIHKAVYRDSPWVVLDGIEAEAAELVKVDPAQAERFFGNRPTAGSGAAFDLEGWAARANAKVVVADRAIVTLGVDGARWDDALAIIGTDVVQGHQFVVGIWEAPPNADDDYEHPLDAVDAAMAECFERYDVWRAYCDPQKIENLVDRWTGRWGEKRIVEWFTFRHKAFAYAIRNFSASLADLTHDGDSAFARHVGNAYKQKINVTDEDQRQMWVISKERPHSPRKMDAAVAAVLSWEARGDCIASGDLAPKPEPRIRILGASEDE